MNGNGSARLDDKPVDGRQAETAPLAGRFCREKGVEGVRQGLVAHADPGVGDRQDEHRPFADGAAEGDREFAAVRHRIAGVERQIDEDLLEA